MRKSSSKIDENDTQPKKLKSLLPIENDMNIVSFGEGFTPLLPIEIGGYEIQMKHDHIFLTGSFKDRGATVLLSKAKELGIERVIEDSSGNAGCAISAYSSKAGIACEIYVPEDVSQEKADQIEVSGGILHRIPGGRSAATSAALDAALDAAFITARDDVRDAYYASHCWNPYFFHGTKTFAFEVCEQLNWTAPDVVILPVGNGTLVLGAFIGFQDLLHADVIDNLPRIIGVQAEQCCPLFNEFHEVRGDRRNDSANQTTTIHSIRAYRVLCTQPQLEQVLIEDPLKFVPSVSMIPSSSALIRYREAEGGGGWETVE